MSAAKYASGAAAMVGDVVALDGGAGPRGRVVVVVGGTHAGAAEGFRLSAWTYLGGGVLIEYNELGLVHEDPPGDETVLLSRRA